MTHEEAAHAIRVLCVEHGSQFDFDALDFILDELKQARQDNGRIIAERDAVRHEISNMIGEQAKRNLEAIRKVAGK